MSTTLSARDITRINWLVFIVVATGFTNVYITQPVLPVLQQEFSASELKVSLTISAVIMGIAIANMPFGIVADRYRIQPIMLIGGLTVGIFGIIGSLLPQLDGLIATRFVQGLALPALMTCMAAYVSRVLPRERLNIVMGTYVAATVTGGLGGRLLGGWLHPPTHWRYALFSAAVLVIIAAITAAKLLPDDSAHSTKTPTKVSFLDLLKRTDVLRLYVVVFCAFYLFSSLFNYLPFRLSAPPINLSTELITAIYLSYLVGIIVGPNAGKLCNHIGQGRAILLGASLSILAALLTLIDSTWVILFAMIILCGGFFTLHASASGALNRRVEHGKGRANALYVLFYYIGGFCGITASGYVYQHYGWVVMILVCVTAAILPLWIASIEIRTE